MGNHPSTIQSGKLRRKSHQLFDRITPSNCRTPPARTLTSTLRKYGTALHEDLNKRHCIP